MARVVVIGSGFGGSIASKRFCEAGHQVHLLELGEDWRDESRIEQSQDPRFLFRLLRQYPHDAARTQPKLLIAQGMGLGGGSLVYSGIHLRAPATAFEGWPDGWTRAALDPFYDRVEARLEVAPLAGVEEYGRSRVLAQGAAAAGLPPPRPNPLAMKGCTRCGWCVPICKWGKKSTMAHTYLADAARTGRLHISTRRKAAFVARQGDRYRVYMWKTDGVAAEYHRVADGPLSYVEADLVVVAGGALESPVLLERSLSADLPAGLDRLRPFPTAQLGRGIDGVGDFIQGGMVPQRVDGYRGSVMMNHIELGDFVLEDLHGIPIGPTVSLEVRLPGQDKGWGLPYKESLRDLGRHMFAIAIIGRQGGSTAGNIWVKDAAGNTAVSGDAYEPPPGSIEAARSIIRALGGQVAETPWELSRTAFTVHPVGGCALGQVVSARNLELVENPGLYVIDGSVLPGGPFRNPSHTIAAVAERALDAIVGGA